MLPNSKRHVAHGAAGLALLVLLVDSGCAHYRIGQPATEKSEPSVAVSTVAVPASWGVETDQLTRRFAADLDRRIAAPVRWTGDGPSTVDCTLDDATENGYVDGHAAEVVARCRAIPMEGDPTTLRTRGRSLANSPRRASDDAPHTRAGATLARRAAARRALERAAVQIAQRLEDEPWANDSTRPASSSDE